MIYAQDAPAAEAEPKEPNPDLGESLPGASRQETDPDWEGASDGHLHQASLRYMVKQFLVSLHMKWRDLEGLAVSRPYHAAKQGQDRHVSEREKQLKIENPKRFDDE